MAYLIDTKGARAYFLYLFSDLTWKEVGRLVGVSRAWAMAQHFASGQNKQDQYLQWPLGADDRYALFEDIGEDDLQDAWLLMAFSNGSANAVAEAIGFEDEVEVRKAATEFGLNSGLGLPYDPYVPALLQRYAELMLRESVGLEVGNESIH
jgi:hypothetical protein